MNKIFEKEKMIRKRYMDEVATAEALCTDRVDAAWDAYKEGMDKLYGLNHNKVDYTDQKV